MLAINAYDRDGKYQDCRILLHILDYDDDNMSFVTIDKYAPDAKPRSFMFNVQQDPQLISTHFPNAVYFLRDNDQIARPPDWYHDRDVLVLCPTSRGHLKDKEGNFVHGLLIPGRPL